MHTMNTELFYHFQIYTSFFKGYNILNFYFNFEFVISKL